MSSAEKLFRHIGSIRSTCPQIDWNCPHAFTTIADNALDLKTRGKWGAQS
jgi:hypothetical protein